MNFTPLAIFLAIAMFTKSAVCHPVKYDQRQEGELNVRTDVEDVVFVVVPPPDLIAAGMGIVAATAADFLRKNYGPVGPEKYPMRTPPKLGFASVEKSPYKIDLEKSGIQVKKISHTGDPNRYNFHDGKNPSKAEIKPPTPTEVEVPTKSTTETMMEMMEMQSTTENKTVKKDLKQEELKKDSAQEKIMPEKKKETTEEKKVMEKKKDTTEPLEVNKTMEKKKEEMVPAVQKKEEKILTDDRKMMEQKKQSQIEPTKSSEGFKSKTDGKRNAVKVVANASDPDSIFRLEDCGPDAYRDSEGKCVIEKPETGPK